MSTGILVKQGSSSPSTSHADRHLNAFNTTNTTAANQPLDQYRQVIVLTAEQRGRIKAAANPASAQVGDATRTPDQAHLCSFPRTWDLQCRVQGFECRHGTVNAMRPPVPNIWTAGISQSRGNGVILHGPPLRTFPSFTWRRLGVTEGVQS